MINFATENYWLNLDKPVGSSSARVVAIVKRLTGAKKVGHGGTLDPCADGILPIAVNKATKTAEAMMAAHKKYCFRIQWGEFRDTDDAEGKVEELSAARPTTAKLVVVLSQLTGKIQQTPSKFSAIKINGKRAYELAREGKIFAMKMREVEIFSIKLISNNQEFCEIEVACSKGTYIRSLARDIAKKLQVCGFVAKLTRFEVGQFCYKNKISLETLKNTVKFNSTLLDGSLLLLQDAVKVHQ